MRPQRTTPNVVCAQCGKAFHVNPFRLGKARFCGWACYLASPTATTHRFVTGVPSPKKGKPGQKGRRFNPAGEFKKGNRVNERYAVGDVVRRCSGRNERNYIKSESGWVFYAVWLWEQKYGTVFKGDVVHHLNGDRFDDRLDNLIALPRTDHPIYHGRWGCKEIPASELARYRSRYLGAV